MKVVERIESIDVLRGVALAGILVMNIQAMAMPHTAYLNPTSWGSMHGLNGIAWSVGRLFFDFKFISIYSFLFGASLVLAKPGPTASRRLQWLIVFGLLHGYLVWYGDILFTYGVVGLVLLPALKWKPLQQAQLGALLVMASSLLTLVVWALYDHLPSFLLNDLLSHYDASGAAAEAEAFAGSWLTQFPVRARITAATELTGTLFENGWRSAGCMLMGMAAMRSGFFAGRFSTPRLIFAAWTSGLALTLVGLFHQWQTNFAPRPWLLAQTLHLLGATLLAAAIALTVVGAATRFKKNRFFDSVARLGRVAFTAYLMQSLVGTFVFGGHGLRQFGEWPRTSLLVAPFAFWLLQLCLAGWWTRRYQQGPMEHLWRRLVLLTTSRNDVHSAG